MVRCWYQRRGHPLLVGMVVLRVRVVGIVMGPRVEKRRLRGSRGGEYQLLVSLGRLWRRRLLNLFKDTIEAFT